MIQLDKEVAVCTAKNIGIGINAKDASDAEMVAVAERLVGCIDEYLKDFAAIVDGKAICPKCGTIISGLFGAFKWGIVHGEGRCARCQWPARGLHYIKDADGKEMFDGPLRMALAYHPSAVTEATK